MQVVFHIISTGGGGGASRTTRYIAEREKDLAREVPGPRPLFSEDREGLSYRKADRILDPIDGQPEKDDLIHLSVSFEEEDFDKLGSDEKEKQARLRQVIREGMKGMAQELNTEGLTWVAGIHRNSDNPHAHIVVRNDVIEHGAIRGKQIGRLRKSLLPHKQLENGEEVVVPGRISEKFLAALEKQQALYLNRDQEQIRAQAAWEQLVERIQEGKTERDERAKSATSDNREKTTGERFKGLRRHALRHQLDYRSIAMSWSEDASVREQDHRDYRIALGKHLEFGTRLAFAEVWYERAVQHGDTYRFNVVDQTTSEERKLSELDVHRRAAARAQRTNPIDRSSREQAFEADLSRHRETLDQLTEVREAKIAALGKDVSSLRGNLAKVEQRITKFYEAPTEKRLTPILSRQTLSELQEQAVKLNLPEKVSELEKLRVDLTREYNAPTRTDAEAATLAAQVNVARADFMARDARLENFEASVHLTPYEIHGERWSLAALDKEILRRQEDTKLVPQRAARLDLRSLARLNYSTTERQQAVAEVEHLTFVRGEVVRRIRQRREPLVADRNLSREMEEILENAYKREQRTRECDGKDMPEPKYERHQINRLEASAETLRDPKLLREVHDWERYASRTDSEINWEGRAVAREITSHLALEETKERLHHFLESKKVASLPLDNHRTGTLREVEARTVTEYVSRAIHETSEQRDHRHTVKLAAREHHGRLSSDFAKAQDYHEAARELASEAKDREPKFTDKEKINLEIYAERQNDAAERERCLELARGEIHSQEREISVSRSR
jgi:hypothetical protein